MFWEGFVIGAESLSLAWAERSRAQARPDINSYFHSNSSRKWEYFIMSSTPSWTQSLSTLCKLSQGTPVQGSRILMFLCAQERKKNLYSVCITSTHMCNYFTWHRHRGNGLERQCVRGRSLNCASAKFIMRPLGALKWEQWPITAKKVFYWEYADIPPQGECRGRRVWP